MELTEIKDIALTLAAFSSIYVGIAGVYAWKRQLQGNTEYVLAKGVLTALYELRGAIDLARNGFQSYYPDLPAEELNKLDPKEKQWLIILNGYRKRWDTITLADAKFKSCLIEVEVVWGRDLITKTKPLSSLMNELFFAMNECCIYDFNRTFNPRVPTDEEFAQFKKSEKILYKSFDEEDAYMKRLEKVISDIENVLKPHILQYHSVKTRKVDSP
ncbi:MAG: hypothetical protein ACOYM1_12060 [Methylovulum sp.]